PRVLPVHAGQETQRRGLRGSLCRAAALALLPGQGLRAACQCAPVRRAGHTARGRVPPVHRGSAMSLISWPYRWLALVLLAAALIGFGWIKGAGHVQAQWDAAVQQQTLQVAAVRERQAQATVKVVTQYVDRVRVVREKGETIIKEVPVYVPVQADAACTINRGFV